MNKITKYPRVGRSEEMVLEHLKSTSQATVKLSGVVGSVVVGGNIEKVEIENLEVSGDRDFVIKALGLLSSRSLPHATDELAYEPEKLPGMPPIGSIYDGDIVGAYIVDDGNIYALLIAGKDAEQELEWSIDHADTEAASYSGGAANTQHLLNRSEGFPAARYCADHNGGGYHLPSRLELSLIAANSEAVEAAELDEWYWSSTQHSAGNAWQQRFSGGFQYNYRETGTYRVRPVRRLKLTL